YRRIVRHSGCAIDWIQLKDEEVDPLILPGVDRPGAGHARAERPVLGRFLERREQPCIGAGQVVAGRILAGDLFMHCGRSDHDWLPSTTHGGFSFPSVVSEEGTFGVPSSLAIDAASS